MIPSKINNRSSTIINPEARDAEEAEELAARYGEIIKKIQSQMID